MKAPKHFLPMSRKEMDGLGWQSCDFLLISGDAYVDHPSFGTALVGRLIESLGFKVGIIAQPQSDADFLALGQPELGVFVSSGNMDSMVNHYTANKKPRSKDLYSPGGKVGLRPDRALIPYCSQCRKLFKNKPVIIGGIEASLRRLVHYDYWSDKLRNSILLDSKAHGLIYGMAERAVETICLGLKEGRRIEDLRNIPGTCFPLGKKDLRPPDAIEIPSLDDMKKDPKLLGRAFLMQYEENNPFSGKAIIQQGGGRCVLHNPPALPLSREELDRLYSIGFRREIHPSYKSLGGIPAYKEVRFSLTSSRGCFGACSFCAIAFHQGEIVHSRSHESLIEEVSTFKEDSNFKGIIHDVGGPTANFRHPSCEKQGAKGPCRKRNCLYPEPCPNLDSDQQDFRSLLKKLREIPGIRKVFIRSGLRYDYMLEEKDSSLLRDLCEYHVSGQLKVAPEHSSKKVLDYMGKPSISVYRKFKQKYHRMNQQLNKKQFLIPYLIASHPGSELKDALNLALFLKETGFVPDQVQDYYPTPGTMSSVMYYTGIDPRSGRKVYIPRGKKERDMQRALIQYNKPYNHQLVRDALIKLNRRDLIGFGENALVSPGKKKSRRAK